MFGPNKVPKSLVDAVSQIMQVDEASEKVPTPTGMKVYGSSYGNSAKARRDQTKSHVDTIKGPKEKDLKEDGDCVTKPEAKDIAKKEVHHHNKTMHKGQKDTTKNEEVEEDKGVMSFKDRLLERAMTDAESKKKEKIVMSMKDKQSYFKKKYGKRWKEVMYATATKKAMSEEMVEEENLDEAKPEELERQRLGIKTPKDLAKYSDVIKKRIAATPASHWKQVKKAAHDDWKKAMGEEVEELEEKNESHTHAAHYENEKGEWTGMNLFAAKDDEDAIRQAHAKCKEGCRLSRVERHIPVKEEVEVDESVKLAAHDAYVTHTMNTMRGRDIADKKQKMATASNTGKGKPLHNVAKGLKAFLQGRKEPMESVNVEGEVLDEQESSVDMLSGRVHQSQPEHNAHKSSKVKLHKAEREMPKGKVSEPMETRSRKSIEAHDGLPTKVDNLDPKYAKPDSFAVHTEAKDPETSDAFGGQANFATNVNTSSDEPKKKVSEGSEAPFDKPYTTKAKTNVKDKSGAVHTPMSRARDLARTAMKRIKTEMLGKAPGNN